MSVTIFTDRTEYSKYHSNLSVITATTQITDPAPGATLNVSLFRLGGYGIVATKTLTLTESTTCTITFDLNKDSYDELGIYRAKQGDYVIQVTDEAGNITQSPTFAISIVPVWEIKNEWAKGVTFWDYEVLEPRVQPQNITGVIISEVSENHGKGPFQLTYTAGSPNTLSWGGGQAVNINETLPQTILLMNAQQDFIMVDVMPDQLPAQSATEILYIDNGRIKDATIIDQIRRATSWVEQRIISKLEPQIVDTDPGANGYADEVAIPETYYRPRTYNKWLSFKLPYPNVLDLAVTGYFNQNPSAVVPREWLVWDERTGICELVPSTAAQVIWSFYNGIFIIAYLFNYASIPGFWHYRATVGLRDLQNERAIVREAIAKKATLELLNSAGSAYRAGYSSQATGRDGVSQSQSYTSSAMYGVYGGHFSSYKEWLETEIPKMRSRFCGLQYVTI